MNKSERLQAARRGNRQMREAARFLNDFHRVTGLEISRENLLEPRDSVRLERTLHDLIQERLNGFTLTRTCELLWPEVESRIANLPPDQFHGKFQIVMANFEDFRFYIPIDLWKCHLKSIVSFDGDTVYAVKPDLTCGIGVDVYESEIVHESRYCLDVWR